MAIQKLVVKEYEVTEDDVTNADRSLGVGDRYSYFFDEETGKFYAPRDGYTVLGDDLSPMFYEAATSSGGGAPSGWLHVRDLTRFNLKEGDVLVVRVKRDSMVSFIEEITKSLEESLAHLRGKVVVAVIDENSDFSNDPTGAEMIFAERKRQIEQKAFDAANDDGWEFDELACVASYYAAPTWQGKEPYVAGWTDFVTRKGECDRIRQLTIAGALIAAEIDRLKRLTRREGADEH